eukprot:1192592-Prorocentrum_minimum.AAC.2
MATARACNLVPLPASAAAAAAASSAPSPAPTHSTPPGASAASTARSWGRVKQRNSETVKRNLTLQQNPNTSANPK